MILTAPILPHLAEEIWEKSGHEYSIHTQPWPEINEKLLEDQEVEIPVQINGKVRGKVKVSTDARQEDVQQIILSEKAFNEYIENKEIKKFIYVPNRIVNLVV
jgi:leucyl-tRNA synthetase